MSGLVHPDQHVRNATQNSLCRAVNRRRGCCACRASNCRRRARFSRTRSSREWKALTNQPRKCRSDTIIAGIISEKYESSFAASHSFCRCTTFWRGTPPLFEPVLPLSLAKMLSGANAFRISGYKLKPEDRMQQCYMHAAREITIRQPQASRGARECVFATCDASWKPICAICKFLNRNPKTAGAELAKHI